MLLRPMVDAHLSHVANQIEAVVHAHETSIHAPNHHVVRVRHPDVAHVRVLARPIDDVRVLLRDDALALPNVAVLRYVVATAVATAVERLVPVSYSLVMETTTTLRLKCRNVPLPINVTRLRVVILLPILLQPLLPFLLVDVWHLLFEVLGHLLHDVTPRATKVVVEVEVDHVEVVVVVDHVLVVVVDPTQVPAVVVVVDPVVAEVGVVAPVQVVVEAGVVEVQVEAEVAR